MTPCGATASKRAIPTSAVRSGAAIVGGLLVYFLAPIGHESSGSAGGRAAVAFAVLLIVVAAQTAAVRRSHTPILRAIEALSLSVSLLLITSAVTYLGISATDSDAFTERLEHVDALYLSMMTATTIGFGDIGATSKAHASRSWCRWC